MQHKGQAQALSAKAALGQSGRCEARRCSSGSQSSRLVVLVVLQAQQICSLIFVWMQSRPLIFCCSSLQLAVFGSDLSAPFRPVCESCLLVLFLCAQLSRGCRGQKVSKEKAFPPLSVVASFRALIVVAAKAPSGGRALTLPSSLAWRYSAAATTLHALAERAGRHRLLDTTTTTTTGYGLYGC